MNRPPVKVNLRTYFTGEEQDVRRKTLIVCHETVSHNAPGTGDIKNVAKYMDSVGLEIHGIIDKEGNVGWSFEPRAAYDHAASGRGMVNTRSIGFELVSEIPFLDTNAKRKAAWDPEGPRKKQLDTLARWIAWLHETEGIPLNYSNASKPGVTSHWDVSQTYLGGRGHWDCKPVHKGGHFPLMYVIYKARQILRGA